MIEYRETHKRCRFCYYLDTIYNPITGDGKETYHCALKDRPLYLNESLFGLEGRFCKWYAAKRWSNEN